MSQWTEEQILALSPDASSTKAGKGLANSKKWLLLARSERAIWGECKGSGKNPYRTRIDLKNIAFKCTCPSRKFPCKHALGLFLLFAHSSTLFKEQEHPDWVEDWLSKRDTKEEKKTQPKKPVDKKAQEKRIAKREEKVHDGIADIRMRLQDLLRTGLANFQNESYEFCEKTAPRMVDSQAPGIAALVRNLEDIPSRSSWSSQALLQLTQIFLLTEGFQRMETLPQATQEDIRTLIGWNTKTDELYTLPVVADNWFVLGRETLVRDDLTIQKNWLFAEKSGNSALILNFYRGNQVVDISLVPGTIFSGEIIYYPSQMPLRAIVKKSERLSAWEGELPAFSDLTVFREDFVKRLAKFPWLDAYPLVLEDMTPAIYEDQMLLMDKDGCYVLLAESFMGFWELLALSGGYPLRMAGVRYGDSILPLGVWQDGRYFVL
ncbi:MAG: SWIM zinc finger family protein [Spirochaetota bacterium]